MALGRTASLDALQEGGYPLVAPSPIPLPTTKSKKNTSRPPSPLPPPSPPPVPRALTVEEMEEYVTCNCMPSPKVARNAVLGAGFDGVEIHAANEYCNASRVAQVSPSGQRKLALDRTRIRTMAHWLGFEFRRTRVEVQ